MIGFELLHPQMTHEHLGFLPHFLDEANPAPAREQLDSNYRHGGGWRPFAGFDMDSETYAISYPGDPSFSPLARAKLHDETILFYESSWVAIIQPDGQFEIARMD